MGVGSSRDRGSRRRGRLYRWFERTVLRFGMGIVASFAERRLTKAMKTGGLRPAPRTAAEQDQGNLDDRFHFAPAPESPPPPEEVPH